MCHIYLDAKTAKEAIRSMYVVLIDGLQTDSLIPKLREKTVISSYQHEVMQSKQTRIEKTDYLLKDVLVPSLDAKVLDKFNRFLAALEESEDDLICQSFAKDLGSKLGKVKVSLPKVIPPSGNNIFINIVG